MRRLPAVLFLLLATNAWAFRGRPVSDLRFDGRAGAWRTQTASDGTDFLVLNAVGNLGSEHTYTQKIANGRPIGPHREIARGGPVNLIWTGTSYLAGWARQRGLWVAPISRDGSPLAAPSAPVVQGDAVFLAANRNGALAFAYTESNLTVQPLGLEGARRGRAIVHAAPAVRSDVTVAAAADGFALVFSGFKGTWLMLFRADGTAITSAPIVLDGPYGGTTIDYHSNEAAIATDGIDTLVVFGAGRHESVGEFKSVLIGANGAIKATRVLHSVADGGARAIVPGGLVWDGAQYVAALNIPENAIDYVGDTAMLRIARDGQRIGDIAFIDENEGRQNAIDVAHNGRELLVPYGTYGTIVNPSTMQPRTVMLARTLQTHDALTLAPGHDGYLAAWIDSAESVRTVRASRIDGAGNYLDGEGIVLGEIPAGIDIRRLNIALDGNGPQWLVLWSDGFYILGKFISRAGVAGAPMTIGAAREVAVRWDGSRYIVLFGGSLRTNTISASGVVGTEKVLAEGEQIEDGLSYGSIRYIEPKLVLLGGRPIAVYAKEHTMCSIGTPGGCGTETTVTGLRLDATDATPFVIAERTWGDIAVAEGPTQALVLWSSYPGLHGAFLSTDAQAGAPFLIDPSGTRSSVAFDGAQFVAAWWLSTSPERRIVTARITSGGGIGTKTTMRLDDGEIPVDPVVAGNTSRAPLVAFRQSHAAYDSVTRGTLLFASELDDEGTPPPAPTVLCATENADGTITVTWQRMHNILGISIELELPDGTFRPIGVAPGDSTTARVSLAGLEGDGVRVRAWNAGGLSAPSSLAQPATRPRAELRWSRTACAGVPETIEIQLSGIAPFTIHWRDGLVQRNIMTTTATRVVTMSEDTTFTIASVTDASCLINEDPESIRFDVTPQPAIANQTRDVRIKSGQTATLTVTANEGARYAWFEGARGNTSRPVGANSATFTTPALTQTTQYWVRVSNRCGVADSDAIIVAVNAKRRAARR